MKLKEGYTAIDFTTVDVHGNEVKLSDYKGKRIILMFMRNVSCPFCNVRVHKLMGNSFKLKKSGAQLVFFFESSADKLRSSVLHQGISPWPLIGDPDKKVYKMYGVENSVFKMLRTMVSSDIRGTMKTARTIETTKDRDTDSSPTLIPADFFINEDFKVVKVHYGKFLDDHVDLDELIQFAEGKLTF